MGIFFILNILSCIMISYDTYMYVFISIIFRLLIPCTKYCLVVGIDFLPEADSLSF